MATCLVTGGCGFIGSHLVSALLARGDTVRVLDNFSTGREENLAGLDGPLTILEGDIRDTQRVTSATRGVDFVFHQAAMISVPQSMLDPQTCFEINVQGTLNIFEAARQANVARVVIASSCAVYGNSQDLPLREDSVVAPLSPYAASKLVTEVYAGMYTRAFDLPVVSLRYFNVFGPRQRPDSPYAAVIPIFVSRLLDGQAPVVYGDGKQKRDFVFVADVVRANLLAAQSPAAPGGVFNVCNGRETSLLDLLEALSNLLPDGPAAEFGPPRSGDIYRSLGDPSHAAQALGFRAQVGLSEGLAQVVRWMQSQRQASQPAPTRPTRSQPARLHETQRPT